jgi:hypothetical protein
MPHRIHKCTNSLYNYAVIINTYVSLMYELKKIGNLFTSKFGGTGRGPRLIEKKNLPTRSLTKVEKHCSMTCETLQGCQVLATL